MKRLGRGTLPEFNEPERPLESYKGLAIIYSRQCPWVARFIEEVKPVLQENHLKAEIIELRIPAEAQRAPSAYGAFSLIFNGKLLADSCLAFR